MTKSEVLNRKSKVGFSLFLTWHYDFGLKSKRKFTNATTSSLYALWKKPELS